MCGVYVCEIGDIGIYEMTSMNTADRVDRHSDSVGQRNSLLLASALAHLSYSRLDQDRRKVII